jgi:hypothetical protein
MRSQIGIAELLATLDPDRLTDIFQTATIENADATETLPIGQ